MTKKTMNLKDGLVEGFYRRSFFETILGEKPKLRSKKHYKNGKKDGLFEYYNENGQLDQRRNYKNGKLEKREID